MPDQNQTDQSYQSIAQGQKSDPAVDMIRQKIQRLYAEEPDAEEELAEAEQHTHPGSKHQQFMAGLQASGRSMAEIQAAWHSYYTELPDHEKYAVWQEFNTNNGSAEQPKAQTEQLAAEVQQAYPAAPLQTLVNQPVQQHRLSAVQSPIVEQFAQALAYRESPEQLAEPVTTTTAKQQTARITDATHSRISGRHRALSRKQSAAKAAQAAGAIKRRIIDTVKTAAAGDGNGKLSHKHHLQSAAFGLACGLVVLMIFLFSFFNEVIIAPFIQPSRQANNTPVIVDTASAVISGGTKIIIPKINLEIPVDYSQTTIDSKAIELALDNGVVHYPSTTKPGETGNAAFFGHSSNNIFNPGKYKFAFVLLHELVEGDIFYLNYGDKTYAYRVFKKDIVTPKQVEVLQPITGKSATATLITCDPPGTSINRLVVVGEQVSPDPNSNGQPAQQATTSADSGTSTVASADSNLPGNGPGLWSRIINRIF